MTYVLVSKTHNGIFSTQNGQEQLKIEFGDRVKSTIGSPVAANTKAKVIHAVELWPGHRRQPGHQGNARWLQG